MASHEKIIVRQEIIVGEFEEHAMLCIHGKETSMTVVSDHDSSFYNVTTNGGLSYAVGYAAAHHGGHYDGFIGKFNDGKLIRTRRYSNSKYTTFTNVNFDGKLIEAHGLMIIENKEKKFSLKMDEHLNILSRRIED